MSSKQDNSVVVRRRIPATREELFDAWIDPEGMREWLCPGDIVSADVQLDPRVGGRLHILMRGPTATYEHTGEFRVFERPSKLVFTWTVNNMDGEITLVTVEFIAVSSAETDLILTHERIPRKEVRDRYRGGWSKIAGHLEEYLGRKRNA